MTNVGTQQGFTTARHVVRNQQPAKVAPSAPVAFLMAKFAKLAAEASHYLSQKNRSEQNSRTRFIVYWANNHRHRKGFNQGEPMSTIKTPVTVVLEHEWGGITYPGFRDANGSHVPALLLAEAFNALQGADAMLRAIEEIIPRNDAHRDYAETVQLFVESLSGGIAHPTLSAPPMPRTVLVKMRDRMFWATVTPDGDFAECNTEQEWRRDACEIIPTSYTVEQIENEMAGFNKLSKGK
jgi:hypothetical protein